VDLEFSPSEMPREQTDKDTLELGKKYAGVVPAASGASSLRGEQETPH